ncbi:lytic transglycosylase domain-containing protein [Magnetospira thiophila]
MTLQGQMNKGARFAMLLLALMLLSVASPVQAASAPSAAEVKAALAAFKDADRRKWSDFQKQRAKVRHADLRKILDWIDLKSEGVSHGFEEVTAFIADNPDWPDQWSLQRRAEEVMPPSLSDERVLAWFSEREPVSVDGRIRYGAALLNTGRRKEAETFLRETWISGDFGPRQESQYLKLYAPYLTQADHVDRLERLLWDDRHEAAKRLLNRVDKDHRLLAIARSRLALKKGGVDSAIAQVPKHLQNDPGLLFDRIRWRRRKGRDDQALDMLLNANPTNNAPEQWWEERGLMARKALKDGLITDAYRIAKNHGLDDGGQFAAAEWLAGWIALRYLNDADAALNHFSNLYGKVNYPISRARAAYWAGRASEALNQKKSAALWYSIGARFPTTFYGQLAGAREGKGELKIPPDARPDATETHAFEHHELVRMALLLHKIGAVREVDPFLLHLVNLSQSAGWRALTADLALEFERPDLAVRIAKKSVLAGQPLIAPGYPKITLPKMNLPQSLPQPERPLLLALIRQESGFNPLAVSSAGARGMMQIIPTTARRLARKIKLRYSKSLLTADPDYNMTIGTYYLASLLDRYEGSYVLALAAYNAGPSRVSAWIKDYGDPRDGATDPIDWIENIPFNETRNYVQRILESLQIYRARLGNTQIALTLEQDLTR